MTIKQFKMSVSSFNFPPKWLGSTLIVTMLAVSFPTIATAKSQDEITQTAKTLTVQINSNGNSPGGSGVIVARNGNTYTVITANHVVCDAIPRPGPVVCRKDIVYTVRTYTGQEYPLSLVEHFQQNPNDSDLAMVTFESSEEYPVAQLGDSEQAAIASDVYVAGFPAAFGKTGAQRDFTLTTGAVASLATNAINGYSLIYDARTKTGMSGGPVFNSEGQLLGIHGLGDTNIPQTGNLSDTQKSGFNAGIPINTFKQLCPKFENCPNVGENVEQPTAKPTVTNLDNPQSARDYYKKGLSLQARGDYQQAINNYTQALQLTPDRSTALSTFLNRGYAYLNLQNWQAAIDDYNQALQIDSNEATAYNERGEARRQLGDLAGAISDYTKAINLDPNLPYAYNNRAFILNRQGDLAGAKADLKKAAELLLTEGQRDQYQIVMNNIETVERNQTLQPTSANSDANVALIQQWNLKSVPCSNQAVSIFIDGKEYCTEPTDWLSLGKYQYIRNDDRLEPITQPTVTSNSQTLAISPQFTFTSVWDYGNCLEDIIQLYLGVDQLKQRGRIGNCLTDVFQTYQNKGLSQVQALELIRAADQYATSQLNPALYPPQGQRRRINKMFGFTYQIDKTP
jgi:S1-C subfamily serine protease